MVPIATWEITSNDDPFQSISLSIYCAGCERDCPGCHSPALREESNGTLMTTGEVLDVIENRIDLIESVVFLGGEWTLYEGDLKYIASECKVFGKKTILYTGRNFFDLPQSLIYNFDIIIDGPYIEELKTNYQIPATSNQQIYVLHVQENLFPDLLDIPLSYHIPVHPSQLPINREN